MGCVLIVNDFLLPLHACHQRYDRHLPLSLLKSNATFHANDAVIGKRDAMAIALWVKADPMAITGMHIELRARCVVDLHLAAPDRYVFKIRLLLIQHLIRCFLA